MALHSRRETYISLYTGGGGLDIGFQLANPTARPILYVEREFQAAALLVDHMEAGSLDPAPLWSDSGTLDCEPFVDRVDWIIGGFPCQPFSVAGNKDGFEDPRWLWPHIERLVREIRPSRLFLENVPGILHGGLERVLGGLSTLGYDAEWISVRASDVGASQYRRRVFILAYSRKQGCEGRLLRRCPDTQRREIPDGSATRTSRAMGLFPPGPRAFGEWRDIIAERSDLAPAIEHKIRGVADGMVRGLARSSRIRILGNGVVPQQAAYAFKLLEERLA